MNILSLLSERAKSHPNKIAFAFRLKNSNMYNEISFKELDQRSSRAAIHLENNGFKRGMKTLVMNIVKITGVNYSQDQQLTFTNGQKVQNYLHHTQEMV